MNGQRFFTSTLADTEAPTARSANSMAIAEITMSGGPEGASGGALQGSRTDSHAARWRRHIRGVYPTNPDRRRAPRTAAATQAAQAPLPTPVAHPHPRFVSPPPASAVPESGSAGARSARNPKAKIVGAMLSAMVNSLYCGT